jgi:transcriptional regulator with XRE-family HTH domain
MKSYNLHISKRRRTFIRLLGEIQNALLEALDEEHRSRGLTRAEIARLIGKNKSFVTRKLNGDSNMTLESLADLAFALDRPVKVRLPSRRAGVGSNSIEPQPTTSPQPPQPVRDSSARTTPVDGIGALAA